MKIKSNIVMRKGGCAAGGGARKRRAFQILHGESSLGRVQVRRLTIRTDKLPRVN